MSINSFHYSKHASPLASPKKQEKHDEKCIMSNKNSKKSLAEQMDHLRRMELQKQIDIKQLKAANILKLNKLKLKSQMKFRHSKANQSHD
jgi:hypothetical protein